MIDISFAFFLSYCLSVSQYGTWYHIFSRPIVNISPEHLCLLHMIFPIAICVGQLLLVARFTFYRRYRDRENAFWQIYNWIKIWI